MPLWYTARATRQTALFAQLRTLTNDGVTDEFVVPCVIEGGAQVKPNDSIIFFNFRPDSS